MEISTSEILAITWSIVSLAIAIALLWTIRRYFADTDGSVFIALLVLPLIVYAVGSGRLAEFSGPGGWGAKFRDASIATVEIGEVNDNIQELVVIAKGSSAAFYDQVRQLDPKQPNALSLRVGRYGYYKAKVIKEFLTALVSIGQSTYVIFIDHESGRFVGSANASQIVALLDQSDTADQFMNALQNGGNPPFGDFNFLVRQSLRLGDTNQQALEKFLTTNAEALVVVDEETHAPKGVVDRNRLMTKLMVKLAGDRR